MNLIPGFCSPRSPRSCFLLLLCNHPSLIACTFILFATRPATLTSHAILIPPRAAIVTAGTPAICYPGWPVPLNHTNRHHPDQLSYLQVECRSVPNLSILHRHSPAMATSTKEAPPKAPASTSASSKPGTSSTAGIKYEYMFETNKSPTPQLDAILRAIAKHVACEVGDKGDRKLTPAKLAAFYKAVGGDYDCMRCSS